MERQVRLRWTSHQGTVLSVFEALLSSESYVDVTLACEGQYIRAHRIILSACSPYFQNLIDLDTSKHPIFFLKDVKFSELKALVEFMYRGEVNILQADLESFLSVAQALKVRGLAEVDTSSCNTTGSETLIIADRAKLKQVNQPTTAASPSATPASSAATKSTTNVNKRVTRSITQSASFSFPSPSSSSTDACIPTPPQPKKPRIGIYSQQAVDPLLASPVVASPQDFNVSTARSDLDANQHQSGFNTHFTEDAEIYHDPDQEVKVENTDVNDDVVVEDDESSMNPSDFSQNWQIVKERGTPPDKNPRGLDSFQDDSGGTSREGFVTEEELCNNSKLPRILDGRFFVPCETTTYVKDGQVRTVKLAGQCVGCGNIYKGDRSSNFIRHLRIQHPDFYAQFQSSQQEAVRTYSISKVFDRAYFKNLTLSSVPVDNGVKPVTRFTATCCACGNTLTGVKSSPFFRHLKDLHNELYNILQKSNR